MFKVERVAAFEYYCPSGHHLPDINHSQQLRFCPECGQQLEEKRIFYDAPYCTNCHSQVSPNWLYCPYCGQGGIS